MPPIAAAGDTSVKAATKVLQHFPEAVENLDHLRAAGDDALKLVPLADEAVGPITGLDDL